MENFWRPHFKYQLVEWLAQYFNSNGKEFERMSYKRLYAIYMKERRKGIYESKEIVCGG